MASELPVIRAHALPMIATPAHVLRAALGVLSLDSREPEPVALHRVSIHNHDFEEEIS